MKDKITVTLMDHPYTVPVPGFDVGKAGPAIEIHTDEDSLAFAGFSLGSPGKAEAWFFVTEEGEEYGIAILRIVRRAFEHELETGKWRRIQVVIPSDFDKCHNLARWFKFDAEGLLKKAGPNDEDCIIYGRIV